MRALGLILLAACASAPPPRPATPPTEARGGHYIPHRRVFPIPEPIPCPSEDVLDPIFTAAFPDHRSEATWCEPFVRDEPLWVILGTVLADGPTLGLVVITADDHEVWATDLIGAAPAAGTFATIVNVDNDGLDEIMVAGTEQSGDEPARFLDVMRPRRGAMRRTHYAR